MKRVREYRVQRTEYNYHPDGISPFSSLISPFSSLISPFSSLLSPLSFLLSHFSRLPNKLLDDSYLSVGEDALVVAIAEGGERFV